MKKDDDDSTSQKKSGKRRTFLDSYKELLSNYPVGANIVQGAILTALSVIISNLIQSHKTGLLVINYNEIIVMAAISAFFITPTLLWFYQNVLNKLPGSMLRKLIVDQFAFSPPFNACIIALRLYLMGSSPVGEIASEVYKVLPIAVTTAWAYWIPVRFITLKYIPPMYHILSGALFSLIWNVIFSLLLS